MPEKERLVQAVLPSRAYLIRTFFVPVESIVLLPMGLKARSAIAKRQAQGQRREKIDACHTQYKAECNPYKRIAKRVISWLRAQ